MDSIDNKTRKTGKSRKYYALIGLFILTIAVVHFAMQLTFIQKENLRSVETAVETTQEVDTAPPVKQYIEIEPEQYEVKKIEIITIPEKVKPAPRVQKESAAPAAPAPVRKIARKKDSGETRAERLRRAERLLTGV